MKTFLMALPPWLLEKIYIQSERKISKKIIKRVDI
jgi:hypothetical protein